MSDRRATVSPTPSRRNWGTPGIQIATSVNRFVGFSFSVEFTKRGVDVVRADGLGTAKTYNGQGYYLLDTSFWPSYETVNVSTVSVASANFADGTVTNGQVMQLVVVPEPAAIGLAVLGVALAAVVRRRK